MYFDVLKEQTETNNQTIQVYDALPTAWVKLMHDMKSPLVSLEACVGEFQRGDLSERQHDVLSLMGQNLAFMRGLLNGHMVHQTASHLTESAAVRHFSLRGSLKSWLFSYQKLCQQKGLDFHVVVDPSVENEVIASDLNLGRIIHNILENALKYTASGSIRCRFLGHRAPGDRYTLEMIFEDSGMGIPSHQLPWLLQPFHQATSLNNRAAQQNGVGLGLSIVNQLVETMGGQIQIESRLEKGTLISIKLPLTLACPRLIEAEEYFLKYPPSKPAYPNHTVLMVGFVEMDLCRFGPYFKYLGFQVDLEENHGKVLEMGKTFDLLCLSEEALRLPNLSDYKALSNKCLVIQQQLFLKDQTLLSETDFCLMEPFRLSDLMDCLRPIYFEEPQMAKDLTVSVYDGVYDNHERERNRQILFIEDNSIHAEMTQRIIVQSGMIGHWLNPNRLNDSASILFNDELSQSFSEPIADYIQKMDLLLVDHFLGPDGVDRSFEHYLEQMMRSIETRPVFILTSNNGFEQHNQLPPVWAWGVLEKPLTQNKLLQVVNYDGSKLDSRALLSQWQSILSYSSQNKSPSQNTSSSQNTSEAQQSLAIQERLLNRIFFTLQKLREQLWEVIQFELLRQAETMEKKVIPVYQNSDQQKTLHLIHELKGTLLLLLPKETEIIQFLLEAERSLWRPTYSPKSSGVFQYSWWTTFNAQLAPYYFALRRMLIDMDLLTLKTERQD